MSEENVVQNFQMVIVTGLSGAGKTQVIRTLEDMDFFCVDNLPPALIPKFVELCNQSSGNIKKIAFVVDIRGGKFFNDMLNVLSDMTKFGYIYKILYLEAQDHVLIRRYKETRRRHPLAMDGRVSEGIAKERNILEQIRGRATTIIDTSNMKPVQLREKVVQLFSKNGICGQMAVTVCSFGFKHGMPNDADLMFDVRFLPNPFYVEKLRRKSGETEEVSAYMEQWAVTGKFLDKLLPLIDFLVPNYAQEGKNNLTIAVGCTGGMHRSVFIARKIYETLVAKGLRVNIEHRDIDKNEHETKLAIMEKAEKIYD